MVDIVAGMVVEAVVCVDIDVVVDSMDDKIAVVVDIVAAALVDNLDTQTAVEVELVQMSADNAVEELQEFAADSINRE